MHNANIHTYIHIVLTPGNHLITQNFTSSRAVVPHLRTNAMFPAILLCCYFPTNDLKYTAMSLIFHVLTEIFFILYVGAVAVTSIPYQQNTELQCNPIYFV